MPEEYKDARDNVEKELQDEINQWWSELSSEQQAKYKSEGFNTPAQAFDNWLENWNEHRGRR